MPGRGVAVVGLLAGLGLVGFLRTEPDPSWAAATAQTGAVPRVIAFGGYAAVAPENTLPALAAAAAAAADALWLDLRYTRDGAPVILRDPTLDRTTACQGPVAEVTKAALANCDAGSWFQPAFAAARVPGLDEALAAWAGPVVIELHAGWSPEAVAVIRSAGAAERIILASFDAEALAAAAVDLPGAPVWFRAGRADETAARAAREAGAAVIAADALGIAWRDVAVAGGQGLGVVAVGPAGEREFFSLEEMGVAGYVTARLEAVTWALDVAFRTYGRTDIGQPNEPGSGFPAALTVGDFNGDGRADLALGSPGDDRGGQDAGWAGVLHGGDRFPGELFARQGEAAASQWGSVFAAGDFNGDGYADLAIGVPRWDFSGQDSGTVWLWDGGPEGIGRLSRPIRDIGIAGALDGAALAVGDFNGDGIDDLAIAAPSLSVAGRSGAGQVTVMLGRQGAGPVTEGGITLNRTLDDIPGLPAAGEALGTALAAADLDGDGNAELVIGAPGASVGPDRSAGAVLVVYFLTDTMTGGLEILRVDELNRATLGGAPEREARLGAALAAAKFSGGFFADLVIGVPGATVAGRRGAGEVVFVPGAASGPATERAVAIDTATAGMPGLPAAGEEFGAILGVGDWNGDGLPDLLLGLPKRNVGTTLAAGSAVVVPATAGGLDPRRSVEVGAGMAALGAPAANRQSLGASVAAADMNGDGRPDLLVAVPGQSVLGVDQAGVLVVGWAGGADAPAVPTATAPPPTATATATITPTPRPTHTPGPQVHIHLPYAGRLSLLNRYPVPNQ